MQQQQKIGMDENARKAKKSSDNCLQTFTIAVFGDSKVGKTSIILRFLGSELSEEYHPTVEEYYSELVGYKQKIFQINIIENSGSYEFPAMRRLAIEKADAFLLVFSADNPASMLKLKRYIDEINEAGKSHKSITVVSNKYIGSCDCVTGERLIERHGLMVTARQFVETEWGFNWKECSALDNTKVIDIFYSLLDQEIYEQEERQKRPLRKISSFMAKTKNKISLTRSKAVDVA